ncbi:MAG TPA: hypothetical protein VGN52_14935 [Burkholderiales bacterium]
MRPASPRRRALLRAGTALALAGARLPARAGDEDEDHRAWQHGIDLLRVDGRLLLIWGSAGNPPRPNLGGDWPHDIYYDWIDAAAPHAAITPHVLVSRPEAQEPPSAALNSRGAILVTAEDGEDDINQRAGLWDTQLRVRKRWPFTIRKGGHSGHAAALGENFLVAYGEDWQEGGGFMDRGTGRNIYARLVDGSGGTGPEITLARGHRDGWPVLAASDRNWLVAWQRYGAPPSLYAATVSGNGTAGAARLVADGLPLRYAYDVAYAAAVERFVVMGNRGAHAFLALLDRDGAAVLMRDGLPPLASEARVVVREGGGECIAVYPMMPRGIAVLRVLPREVELVRTVDHAHRWDYMGTTGLFTAPGRVLLATLTLAGVRLFAFEF